MRLVVKFWLLVLLSLAQIPSVYAEPPYTGWDLGNGVCLSSFPASNFNQDACLEQLVNNDGQYWAAYWYEPLHSQAKAKYKAAGYCAVPVAPPKNCFVAPAKEKNRGCIPAQEPGKSCGNPINSTTGNKFQRETDYSGPGVFPLQLVRAYNSQSGSVRESLGQTGHIATAVILPLYQQRKLT